MVEPISAGIIAGGSLLSGLLGAGASMGSAYQQYKYQKKLQQQSASLNYKYSKKLTKWQQQNTPTYTRQGLESAGYNPLLALGTNIGSAGTSFTGTGQASAPDFSQGLSSALDWANYYKDKKETESRIGVNVSQAALNSATKVKTDEEASATAIDNVTRSALNIANIDKLIADTSLAKSQEDLNIMNKEWLPKQYKASIEQGYMNANANYQGALASMQSAKAAIIGANASMMNAETNKYIAPSIFDMNSANAFYNFNRSLGYNATFGLGPKGLAISTTGNKGHDSKWVTHYETINGKRVKVRSRVSNK